MTVNCLQSRIQNKRVAIGDSRTLLELKVHDALSKVNDDITDINDLSLVKVSATLHLRTMGRDVFLTSVNALSQTGEMVNIDGLQAIDSSFFIWFPKRFSLC